MASFQQLAWSSIGKKVVSGVTGLALFGYVIVHLLGNLSLFIGPSAFNGYAHFLESLLHGWFVIVFEVFLLAVFGFHIVTGVAVAWVDKVRARPQRYAFVRDQGGASRKTIASRSMIVTGIVLGAFVVWHVWTFKFGAHGEFTNPEGHEIKDLYTTVVAAFNNPLVTFAYVAVMILLGTHLWHGVWSSFQSLGWLNDRWMPLMTGIGYAFATVLAVGFLILPLYVFFFVDPASASAAMTGGN
jgi:succinate dehydrogenase / fumarate reductase cytochrome b subunit